MNQGISKQRSAATKAAQETQNVMFDALGKMQLQNEREIAQRRIQAQRAGMTSSQLAAFEMQNIMTAQLGATQAAQQFRQEQGMIETQFAGAEEAGMAEAFQILNTNRANVAAIDAQRYAASGYAQVADQYGNDLDPEIMRTLTKDYLGQELSSDEKDVLNNYLKGSTNTAVSSFASTKNIADPEVLQMMLQTAEPVDFKTFSNLALNDTRSGSFKDYEDYIALFNNTHKSSFMANKTRKTSGNKWRADTKEELQKLITPEASDKQNVGEELVEFMNFFLKNFARTALGPK